MKVVVDKEYMASFEGVLRVAALGIGGAIFGTIAENKAYFFGTSDFIGQTNADSATAHFLMWVAVFAWALTTIIFIFGLLSNPLFAGGAEYRINFFFAVLYFIAAIVYGRFNVQWANNRDTKILVLVFACINWLVYMVLFLLQLCKGGFLKDIKKNVTPKKKAKKTADKTELKEQTEAEAEAATSVQVVENGKDEEPESQQPQAEQTEQSAA